jgi:hypothetical protein
MQHCRANMESISLPQSYYTRQIFRWLYKYIWVHFQHTLISLPHYAWVVQPTHRLKWLGKTISISPPPPPHIPPPSYLFLCVCVRAACKVEVETCPTDRDYFRVILIAFGSHGVSASLYFLTKVICHGYQGWCKVFVLWALYPFDNPMDP